jgi:cyclomaltodextrinase / maltogenic alpha-amylase / neopullulanase
VLRTARGAISGGKVCFNDRYAWEGEAYAALREEAPLWLYARDGDLEYWAADLRLHPPRLRYRFGLETDDGLHWYGWDGLRDEPAPVGAFEFGYIAEGDQPDSPAWARGAVFYHIFPDRFARGSRPHRRGPLSAWDAPPGRQTFLGGDLDGIREQLDHIASLSVDALYLTPIFSSPSNHKYDTSDYFSVDPDFGGNAALRRLVEALHQRGMRLLLDGVFNHAGAEWPPFVDVRRRGRESPYAEWFYLAEDDGERAADHLRHGYETWSTNVAAMPKLRTSERAVRDLICRVGRFWVEEFGIDGWRLDVANEVDHRLWRDFRRVVRDVQPEAFLLGEIWWPALPWLRGDQFDSVMNYPFRQAILDFAGRRATTGEGFLDAIDGLRAQYPEPVHGFLYNLLGSHDEGRPLTACGGDRQRFALASALLFMLPGAVSIYYGDEVGMQGGDDPGSRGGMIWDAEQQDARLLELYRRLGRLRRTESALRHGRYQRLHADGRLVVFARGEGDQRLLIAGNGGERAVNLPVARLSAWLDGSPTLRAALAYDDGGAELKRDGLRLAPGRLALIGRTEHRSRGQQ